MGGHLWEKTTEMLKGKRGLEEEGVGIGRGKDICVVGLQEVESVVRIACFCQKRQDSDKLSFPCSHLSPPHSACCAHAYTHAHARTHTYSHSHKTVTVHNSPLKWMDCHSVTRLTLQGEMVLVHQQKTVVLWGATACDRMLNCFRVNNLLSLHEPQFTYLPRRFQHSVLRWK